MRSQRVGSSPAVGGGKPSPSERGCWRLRSCTPALRLPPPIDLTETNLSSHRCTSLAQLPPRADCHFQIPRAPFDKPGPGPI